jgi:hypothetical protein
MKIITARIIQILNKLHIGHGIAVLALLAAITGTAACVLPTIGISTHSLTLVSTLSGAASTIVSAHQSTSVRK